MPGIRYPAAPADDGRERWVMLTRKGQVRRCRAPGGVADAAPAEVLTRFVAWLREEGFPGTYPADAFIAALDDYCDDEGITAPELADVVAEIDGIDGVDTRFLTEPDAGTRAVVSAFERARDPSAAMTNEQMRAAMGILSKGEASKRVQRAAELGYVTVERAGRTVQIRLVPVEQRRATVTVASEVDLAVSDIETAAQNGFQSERKAA